MPKICFPMMGNYYIPITYFFKHIFKDEIMESIKITSRTLELGTLNSPNFVCMPFKYTLGSMIEGLDKGANIVFQMGGGCRYGYYSELQECILKDMGYKFKMVNLVTKGKPDLREIYRKLKDINPKLNVFRCIYYLIITSIMVRRMDYIDDYIRENIGFEVENDSFNKLRNKMYDEFSNVKSIIHMHFLSMKYKKLVKKIKINKDKNYLKIGIVGELYTLMEPFSNFDLESMLKNYKISIKRYTNVWYLLYKKKLVINNFIKKLNFIKYKMGADAVDNIYRTKYLCEHNYDGIIHIKSTFCTPEIGAMPIINKICKEYDVPVIFFSFDSSTSLVGLKTRIEAFYDMLMMRKEVASK